MYTRAEDTLNPEDLIYPRAVTRVGPKFQANVMSWEQQVEAERRRQESLETVGPSRLICELNATWTSLADGSGTRL